MPFYALVADWNTGLDWHNARFVGVGAESCGSSWRVTFHCSFLYLSNVPVDYSSDVMACPTAAYESIIDVATITAQRAFIWTSFAITSYMVFVLFTHAVYVSHTIFAIYIIDPGSSCGTSPSTRAYNAHTYGS